jgi:hypothetical protein
MTQASPSATLPRGRAAFDYFDLFFKAQKPEGHHASWASSAINRD